MGARFSGFCIDLCYLGFSDGRSQGGFPLPPRTIPSGGYYRFSSVSCVEPLRCHEWGAAKEVFFFVNVFLFIFIVAEGTRVG